MQFPDMVLGFYDVVVAFDHELEKAWIFSSGFPLSEKRERKERAEKRLQWMSHIINQQKSSSILNVEIIPGHLTKNNFSANVAKPTFENKFNAVIDRTFATDFKVERKDNQTIAANFTVDDYQYAVRQVIDYILAGDIFEACISQRFKGFLPNGIKSFDLYCLLRSLNPAPFAAYINFFDMVIASASPERFLQLTQGKVESRPIKGTRSRGKTAAEDASLIKELMNSEKDHAENVMIVDLLRNDLSRVCKDHSVKVPQLCGLETYATVHHLVSVITGQLNPGLSAIDLLCATFPGGSITGAPKIRAMEIIAEIEPNQRGPYCGSIGYISFNGDMDSSIVIRTYAIKNNIVTFQAGGAIVADSDPLNEYQETLVKASALRNALTIVNNATTE
ncbi:MAG: aminodeoxychorismate synthase component I [Gammaproteobacteria bacterium]|nr:aminodeoxychorismate synthase component I [Gammaproteobacteria bacterium]